MQKMISLSDFDQFMDGAIKERLTRAIGDVAQNILDLNTDPEKVRKVTITMSIKPTKNRRSAVIKTQVATKLAALSEMESDVAIGVDENGEMVIVQQTDMLPGQIDMDGNEQPQPNVITIPAYAR